MADRSDLTCYFCGHKDFSDGFDGHFYCQLCGSQDEDIVDTAVNEEDVNPGGIYKPCHRRRLSSGNGFATRVDEASYYKEIRERYVMGIQMQCEALVEKLNVSKVILGLAGTFWLRFLYSTGVFDDDWAQEAINESESQNGGQRHFARLREEPTNFYNQRAVMIWFRSLRNKIPLSHSLAITFLACHVATESVLPTDISKWLLEGKLPYIVSFVEIEKKIKPPSVVCPLTASVMFKPSEGVSLRKLESQAASIAQTIGLELPPVNFYAIALRYLRKLSLPVEKILPSICRIYEWSLPPELWLSENELRLPTRVGVMSLVIVAIRMLYNIHGFGIWEKSLSTHSVLSSASGHDGSSSGFANNSSSHVERPELDVVKLLRSLDARYSELERTYDYCKDLSTYLHYCKDVVFAGLGVEDLFLTKEVEDLAKKEEKIIDELWKHYETHKDDATPSSNQEMKSDGGFHKKRSSDEVASLSNDCEERRGKRRSMHCPQARAAKSNRCVGKSIGPNKSSKSNNMDSASGASHKEKHGGE